MTFRLMHLLLSLLVLTCACSRKPDAGNSTTILPAIKPVNVQPEMAITFQANDWPMWRGGLQDGKTLTANSVPQSWSENKNVLWKSEVPGRGHSSPVTCQGRVFLTTADEEAKTQSVLAFDATTGKLLWSTQVHQGGFPQMHAKNSHASATACCDGTHVYTAFVNHDKLWASALDMDGKVIWQTEAGPFQSEHGFGASPTMAGSLLILNGDSLGLGYLAAVNRGTGDLIWRTARDAAPTIGNYASPIVADLAGAKQVVQAGFNSVSGYDILTGKPLWSVAGPAQCVGNTLAIQAPFVVASGGYPEHEILGIRIDDLTHVTPHSILWKGTKNVAYVPSPIIAGEQVLVLSDDGPLASYDLQTGKRNWQKRLPGSFTASLTQVGSQFMVPNEAGETIVFEIEPEFKVVSRNKLADEGGMATPCCSDHRILIRTDHSLYAIGHTAISSR